MLECSTVAGGGKLGGKGYFVEPTVLVDTNPDMKVIREEIFGPVVAAIPFKDLNDDLVKAANDTIYGLAAGVFVCVFLVIAALESVLHGGEEQGLTPDGWQPEHAGAYIACFVVLAGFGPIVE